MLITARTTGIKTVVMNGNSSKWVIWQCLGRNGKTERSWVIVRKPRVMAQMRRGGRSFQTVAPETGNARLPTVQRRTSGTSRRCEVEDRSRRLAVMSATRVKHDCRYLRVIEHTKRSRDASRFCMAQIHDWHRQHRRSYLVGVIRPPIGDSHRNSDALTSRDGRRSHNQTAVVKLGVGETVTERVERIRSHVAVCLPVRYVVVGYRWNLTIYANPFTCVE